VIKKLFSPELKVFELSGVFNLSSTTECSLLPLQGTIRGFFTFRVRGVRGSPLPLIIYHKPSRTKPKYEGVASEFDDFGHWDAGIIENAIVRK